MEAVLQRILATTAKDWHLVASAASFVLEKEK